MNGLLALLLFALGVGVATIVPTGGPAVLAGAGLTIAAAWAISRVGEDREFLLRLFAAGLIFRVVIGTVIFVLKLQDFFGGDAYTYDDIGYALMRVWQGELQFHPLIDHQFSAGGGWGMLYYVAVIYRVVGRNMLAVQYANAVLGAATAVVIFLCAQHIFRNLKVSRIAGCLVAFYPSLVLWSSQGLKDGPTVFFLALAMLATLKLGERLSAGYFFVLAAALFATLSLRFYVFYMVMAAVGGAFVIGMKQVDVQSLTRQFVIVVGLGLAMTYLGVLRTASTQIETFGSLEAVQRSRSDLARGQSGFGQDVDVSTTSGALRALPVGMVYLLFAPFPWQFGSLRQSITLPEMVFWWAVFPLFFLGVWFTVKFRLRQALPILIFTAMLTLAYSLFQSNIGTAYRQRSQLLVFYFIFVATGFVLFKERGQEIQQQALAEKQASRARRASHRI